MPQPPYSEEQEYGKKIWEKTLNEGVVCFLDDHYHYKPAWTTFRNLFYKNLEDIEWESIYSAVLEYRRKKNLEESDFWKRKEWLGRHPGGGVSNDMLFHALEILPLTKDSLRKLKIKRSIFGFIEDELFKNEIGYEPGVSGETYMFVEAELNGYPVRMEVGKFLAPYHGGDKNFFMRKGILMAKI